MTEPAIAVHRWAKDFTAAMAEVAASSLGCEVSANDVEFAPSPDLCGSLISLVSGRHVVCVGFSSTPDGCRRLAGAMLGLDATEALELSVDEVRDSIGELVNIVAGTLKTKVSNEDDALALGLPMHFEGLFEGESGAHGSHVPCLVGETSGVLTLMLAAAT